MTDIKQKALALVTQLQEEDDGKKYSYAYYFDALCRALEQHEVFRQEVSDAAVEYNEHGAQSGWLGFDHFIIAKPDPLVDAWQMAFPGNHIEDARDECAKISAAIEARGGRIVWEGE